jgi:hypothetical protein
LAKKTIPQEHVDPLLFLNQVHGSSGEGKIEVRATNGQQCASEWFDDPGDFKTKLARFESLNDSGWAIRFSQGRRKGRERGGVNTFAPYCIAADFDDGATLDQVKAAIAGAKVGGTPIPPASCFVETSPNAFQVFWWLTEPFANAETHAAAQKALAEAIGSDPTFASPEQCPRLPGFRNAKDEDGKADFVVRVREHNDQRHAPSAFPEVPVEVETPVVTAADSAVVIKPGSMSKHTKQLLDRGLDAYEHKDDALHLVKTDLAARGWTADEIFELVSKVLCEAGLDDAAYLKRTKSSIRRLVKKAAKGEISPGESDEETFEILMDGKPVTEVSAAEKTDEDENEGDPLIEWSTAAKVAPPPPSPLTVALDHPALAFIASKVMPVAEASVEAVVFSYLTMLGNCIGRGAHVNLGFGAEHHTGLFICLIGDTARGRKGTGVAVARSLFSAAAPDWAGARIVGGIASGEALVTSMCETAPDKRLLINLSEFSSYIAAASRKGSTLAGYTREGWDGSPLANITKENPEVATDYCLSMIGAITSHEFKARVDPVGLQNGFFNRFIWVHSSSGKVLPIGVVPRLKDELAEVKAVVQAAQHLDEVRFTKAAGAAYTAMREVHAQQRLTEAFAKVIGRRDQQIARLALILALGRKAKSIDVVDLEAARDLWRYSEESVSHVLGVHPINEDPDLSPLAAELLSLVRGLVERGDTSGVTRTELFRKVGCHRDSYSRSKGHQAVDDLVAAGLVELKVKHLPHQVGKPSVRVTLAKNQGIKSTDGLDAHKSAQLKAQPEVSEKPRKTREKRGFSVNGRIKSTKSTLSKRVGNSESLTVVLED